MSLYELIILGLRVYFVIATGTYSILIMMLIKKTKNFDSSNIKIDAGITVTYLTFYVVSAISLFL